MRSQKISVNSLPNSQPSHSGKVQSTGMLPLIVASRIRHNPKFIFW